MARRQFQLGPSEFVARADPASGGWCVFEVWWEMSQRLEKEDHECKVGGPTGEASARAQAAALKATNRMMEAAARMKAP